MIIAVTYDMGQIFQHFGHTEYFALYTVEDGEVKSSEIVSSNGSGHGALAGFLAHFHPVLFQQYFASIFWGKHYMVLAIPCRMC